MKHLATKPNRAYLLIITLLILLVHRPALAHNGVDHNNSCFLTVGDTRLRISGYQFQPELEGKHFCHFFPELGQIVLAVEPLQAGKGKDLVELELAALTSWLHPGEAFTVIKRQPEQPIDTGLASISQTIAQRGVYRLTVNLKDEAGNQRQQRMTFLVGVPVTKILVIIAGGLLVWVLGFLLVSSLKQEPD
ncbi:hypothetical protein [Candidatus Methylobacter oryzae]|uniref:hypothetical protein n=1 Tax=Candidatus Methylobacter oryzae TaxID=2497749 RepID=UPI001F4F27D9|nr:hypothetical protein [Candidatus Methylobacter oryzae]